MQKDDQPRQNQRFARKRVTRRTAKIKPTNMRTPIQICLATSLFALLFCAVSAWGALPIWEAAFRSDGSAIAWLSSALLFANATVALRLGLDRSLSMYLSSWLTVAIFVLALDEQFMFHEQWKYTCASVFDVCRGNPWVRELPIPMVGFVGLLTAAWLHTHLPPGQARWCLWAALLVGIWAIVVDQVAMPAMIAVFEEGFEVLAESIFLGVLLSVKPSAIARR